MSMTNKIFTVDVEEYYHAENILSSLPEDKIKSLPDRLKVGLNKLLDLLEKSNSKATFFVLGGVAEKNRDLIKRISNSGHEIASHGYEHMPLYKHTTATFEEDLSKSIKILSDITGQKIIGYRSTSFSFPEKIECFFDVLRKYGLVYDSSLSLSLFRGRYRKFMDRLSYCEKHTEILEFPPSFISFGPVRFPLGGGYFRAYPYWLTVRGLRAIYYERKMPPLFYIHPWELDAGQPRFKIPYLRAFRHYCNLNRTEKKLQKLLSNIEFTSIKNFLGKT